jgi:tetratricopeptide (TPR) repeat protein
MAALNRVEAMIGIFHSVMAARVLALLACAIGLGCAAGSIQPVSEAPPSPESPPVSVSDMPPSLKRPPAPNSDSPVFQLTAPADSRKVTDLLRLAEAERSAGNQAAEYAYLAQVIEHDDAHSRAHSRLAEITGRAPTSLIPRSDDLVLRAQRYPYDPRALVAGAEALAQRGRDDEAAEYLERAVWLADLDPSAALIAIRRLQMQSDEWKRRRIVPVQLNVDELIRAQPGWRFEMRALWLSVSEMLDSVLDTRFVPIAILPFSAGDTPNDLDLIHEAFLAEGRPPAEGIFAAITGRPVPSGDAVYKKGVAEFLGRSLVVRVAPGAIRSRVLAHEILHLYGAIHVLDGIDTLMNPTGGSLALDAPNIRVVRSLRGREFGAGGIEQNVLPWIDLGETVAAYRSALSVNLSLRDAEIKEAMSSPDTSSEQAAFRLQQATQLDMHLADAARLVAVLMLADGQRAEALRLLDLSSQLYGLSTPRGHASAEKAKLLRESIGAANALGIE